MRSRAAAGLLLLVVAAHAFIGSATHFHSPVAPETQSAHAALDGDGGGGQNIPQPGDAAQCLLCRLQRNFVSADQGATLVLAPPPAEALDYAALQDITAHASRSMFRPGRAPPSF